MLVHLVAFIENAFGAEMYAIPAFLATIKIDTDRIHKRCAVSFSDQSYIHEEEQMLNIKQLGERGGYNKTAMQMLAYSS